MSDGVIGNTRHVSGRSSYIEQSRDSTSQCGHLKRRLQLAPHEMQPPVKPCLRCKCKAKPGTQQMIARRILPRMIVLPVFRKIASGLTAIAHMNARKYRAPYRIRRNARAYGRGAFIVLPVGIYAWLREQGFPDELIGLVSIVS